METKQSFNLAGYDIEVRHRIEVPGRATGNHFHEYSLLAKLDPNIWLLAAADEDVLQPARGIGLELTHIIVPRLIIKGLAQFTAKDLSASPTYVVRICEIYARHDGAITELKNYDVKFGSVTNIQLLNFCGF